MLITLYMASNHSSHVTNSSANYSPKVAIVCDWLVTIGGAEKVLQEILDCFPQADIYSIIEFIAPNKRDAVLGKRKVTTSFIQHMPAAKRFYRNYLLLMPLAIEQFDLEQYDIVISSSHAVAKGVILSPNQVHICYCHSPMRYVWDMQSRYLRDAKLVTGILSFIVRFMLHKLRIWDVVASNRVDYFVANSQCINKRIKKIYRRDSVVIYPPVASVSLSSNILNYSNHTHNHHANHEAHTVNSACLLAASKSKFAHNDSGKLVFNDDDFYVVASRMVSYKRMDVVIEAFLQAPWRNLVVIGNGPCFKALRKLARHAANIKILGYQADEVLWQYLANARAMVFAAEEDFGILPVETQALGTPVIAYAKGGALETVIDYEGALINGKAHEATGLFFEQQNASSIIKTLNRFEQIRQHISKDACITNALRFSQDVFKKRFYEFVMQCFASHNIPVNK